MTIKWEEVAGRTAMQTSNGTSKIKAKKQNNNENLHGGEEEGTFTRKHIRFETRGSDQKERESSLTSTVASETSKRKRGEGVKGGIRGRKGPFFLSKKIVHNFWWGGGEEKGCLFLEGAT